MKSSQGGGGAVADEGDTCASHLGVAHKVCGLAVCRLQACLEHKGMLRIQVFCFLSIIPRETLDSSCTEFVARATLSSRQMARESMYVRAFQPLISTLIWLIQVSRTQRAGMHANCNFQRIGPGVLRPKAACTCALQVCRYKTGFAGVAEVLQMACKALARIWRTCQIEGDVSGPHLQGCGDGKQANERHAVAVQGIVARSCVCSEAHGSW